MALCNYAVFVFKNMFITEILAIAPFQLRSFCILKKGGLLQRLSLSALCNYAVFVFKRFRLLQRLSPVQLCSFCVKTDGLLQRLSPPPLCSLCV